jgi:uncharacterized repeat protein (TIGR01451 family)
MIWNGVSQVGDEARGVVVDSNDDVWVIHVNANKMSKFKGTDGSPLGVFDTGLHPYTYSDATGLGLRSSIVSGKWTVIKDSGNNDTNWNKVAWNSSVPEGTIMTVKVRTSNDQAAWSVWEIVTSGGVFATTPNGRYLQVEVSMQTITGQASPILYDLTIGKPCETPGPSCGDGACNGSENCSSCSQDCGSCSSGGGGTPLCFLLGNCPGATGFLSEASSEPTVLGEEGAPKLLIAKSVSKAFANPGDKEIMYNIKITNNGNLTAFETVLNDSLPAGLSFADSEVRQKTWQLGDIAPGETKEVNYKVNVDKDAKAMVYTNTAEASAKNHDVVRATASLEVKDIKVLAATGFNLNELVFLGTVLFSLLGLSLFFKRRLTLIAVSEK